VGSETATGTEVAPAVPRAKHRRPPREKGGGEGARVSRVLYPRWYWPSFAASGTIWLALLFVLPFYVVFAVAFGTSDLFGNALPVYQPWYWTGSTFTTILNRFYGGDAFYQPALIRTLVYVPAASLLCLVLGYGVAYYVARHAGRRKGLYLILLISPFWISYLMRIYAWQGLLQPDGLINKILTSAHVISSPVSWLQGRPFTVILGLMYGYIPYMILPMFGFLDRIDQNLLEAGRDLGAGPVKTFVRVTLPLSRQAILAGMVIVALPMFGDYFTNDLLGSTKTSMYGNLIDNALSLPGESPQAASLVLMLLVLLIVPLLYYLRTTKRAQEAA
jgi:ABC-type spermidine/putrescine transport system permease subunit I